jgi:hypothetical protein
MTGPNAFDQMVTATTTTRVHFKNHISQDKYERWRKDFSFLALKGQRYGQSFCNSFGITDNHLYYAVDNHVWADEYIRKHYIERT